MYKLFCLKTELSKTILPQAQSSKLERIIKFKDSGAILCVFVVFWIFVTFFFFLHHNCQCRHGEYKIQGPEEVDLYIQF